MPEQEDGRSIGWEQGGGGRGQEGMPQTQEDRGERHVLPRSIELLNY